MDLGESKHLHCFPSIRPRWKTVDIDSAAKLPTKTDGQNTYEYMLDNAHRFRSGKYPALDFRHFPLSEDLILMLKT